jgi:hypothetical protein
MFVLGVVVVRQHRGAHVPLELFQRQGAPLVARGGSSARHGETGEPPIRVQREAASVGKVSELMHDKGDPLLEVLDKFLDFLG